MTNRSSDASTRDAAPAERRTSREAVIETALRIVDSDGAAALSMRRLADEVGVPVMTLYGFVRTKQEVVLALSDRAFDGLSKTVRRKGTWQEQLRAVTDELHDALRRHPGVVELILTNSVSSSTFDDVREVMLAILRGAGLEHDDALHALGGFFSLTLGFAVAEAARERSARQSVDEARRLRQLHPNEYPNLTQFADDYPTHLSEQSFAVSVEYLINGFSGGSTLSRGKARP